MGQHSDGVTCTAAHPHSLPHTNPSEDLDLDMLTAVRERFSMIDSSYFPLLRFVATNCILLPTILLIHG